MARCQDGDGYTAKIWGLFLNPILVSTMALFGVIAGYIGWRRATKPIYRRTYVEVDLLPTGVTRREYDRVICRRRKLWRLVITFFYAIAGAVAGVLFLMFPGASLSTDYPG